MNDCDIHYGVPYPTYFYCGHDNHIKRTNIQPSEIMLNGARICITTQFPEDASWMRHDATPWSLQEHGDAKVSVRSENIV